MEYLVIKNVLTNKERKKLLKDCKPFLHTADQLKYMYNKEAKYAGKQTKSMLHENQIIMKPMISIMKRLYEETGRNFVIRRSWINWTNGSKSQELWHTHGKEFGDWIAVYYIKTPLPFFSNGTLFREKFVKAPQNSLLLFPNHLEHTAPTSPFRLDRYTMGIDLFLDFPPYGERIR
tara:strand:- start:43 stop:570 length:528 start_codon:yes stop_codon:yes gene_type:complete